MKRNLTDDLGIVFMAQSMCDKVANLPSPANAESAERGMKVIDKALECVDDVLHDCNIRRRALYDKAAETCRILGRCE